MLFNIFKKQTAKEFVEEAKETYMVPEVKSAEPNVNEDALYMVGMNDHGMVQLRVGTPYAVTLTMNNSAVKKLIKQLEAAMPEEEKNEVAFQALSKNAHETTLFVVQTFMNKFNAAAEALKGES